jgi:DNA-directed RNA polymerase subunit RPC12/RpoP
MIEFKCRQCGAEMESPESQAGKADRCPQCKVLNRVPWPPRTMTNPALEKALAELAADFAEYNPDVVLTCEKCGKVRGPWLDGRPNFDCPDGHGIGIPAGGTAGHYLPSTVDTLVGALRMRRDWRAKNSYPAKIDLLAQMLGLAVDPSIKEPRSPVCYHCRRELPSRPNHTLFDCPHCEYSVYLYNGLAFINGKDCERFLESLLEKKKKAAEKARQCEIEKAAKEIAKDNQQ